MPTYQYACTECGHSFEIVQSFTDAALTECRQCAGRLRKVFNSVGIVFKGSGFYRTDSREGAKGAKSTDKGSTDSKAETAKESAKPKADSSGASSGSSASSSSGTSSSSTSTAGSAA